MWKRTFLAVALAPGLLGGWIEPSGRAAPSAPPENQIIAIFDEQSVEFDKSLADGTQLPIMVDLYAALRDPAERIIIQPGDYLLLQYTCPEAVLAFVERHLLAGALFSLAAAQVQTGGGN